MKKRKCWWLFKKREEIEIVKITGEFFHLIIDPIAEKNVKKIKKDAEKERLYFSIFFRYLERENKKIAYVFMSDEAWEKIIIPPIGNYRTKTEKMTITGYFKKVGEKSYFIFTGIPKE
jgi:hypothetical protein